MSGSENNAHDLHRSRSTTSVQDRKKHPLPSQPLDPEISRVHALIAAHRAMDRSKSKSLADIGRRKPQCKPQTSIRCKVPQLPLLTCNPAATSAVSASKSSSSSLHSPTSTSRRPTRRPVPRCGHFRLRRWGLRTMALSLHPTEDFEELGQCLHLEDVSSAIQIHPSTLRRARLQPFGTRPAPQR